MLPLTLLLFLDPNTYLTVLIVAAVILTPIVIFLAYCIVKGLNEADKSASIRSIFSNDPIDKYFY